MEFLNCIFQYKTENKIKRFIFSFFSIFVQLKIHLFQIFLLEKIADFFAIVIRNIVVKKTTKI